MTANRAYMLLMEANLIARPLFGRA